MDINIFTEAPLNKIIFEVDRLEQDQRILIVEREREKTLSSRRTEVVPHVSDEGKLLRTKINCGTQRLSELWFVSFIHQHFMTFTDPWSVENHVKNLDVSRAQACPSILSMTPLMLSLSSASCSPLSSLSLSPLRVHPRGDRFFVGSKNFWRWRNTLGSLSICFKPRSPCWFESVLCSLSALCLSP